MLVKLKPILISSLKVMGNSLLFLSLVASVIFLSFKSPEMFDYIVRKHIGNRVYHMTANPKIWGGGTGFAVVDPYSGKTYILTNDHVCNLSTDGTLYAVSDDGTQYIQSIIKRSDTSDLCLLTAPLGVKGLKLAEDKPELGQKLMAVGHPRLYPLVISYGNMVNIEDITIVGKRMENRLDGTCNLKKNSISYLNKFNVSRDDEYPIYEHGWFCEETTKQAYNTSITILGGNSGSPLLNLYGKVEGIIFANNRANAFWGSAVSLADIKELLKNK